MVVTKWRDKESSPTYRGGNADVFQGDHDGRRVAIKVVRLTLSDCDKHTKVGSRACANYGNQSKFRRFSEVLQRSGCLEAL